MAETGKTFKDDLRTVYDQNAALRDSDTLQDWKIAERQAFLNRLTAGGLHNLLEIGSGPGKDGLFFQENGMQVTCVDYSPGMVELCRAKGLSAQVMDMMALEFEDGAYYAVYALNSLLHIPKADLPIVLGEIRRVLRPGGLFYLGVYGGGDFEGIAEWDFYLPKRFFSFHSDESIRKAVSPYFEILDFHNVDTDNGKTRPFQSLTLMKNPLHPNELS
jgi:SAM-dependent methyltransferase